MATKKASMNDEHGVTKAKEAVLLSNGSIIAVQDKLSITSKSRYQHQQRRFGQMKVPTR